MLLWRNEDYKRRFLGFENDVFLVQNYSQKDASKFIKDIKKYLVSKKYIRIKGKPALGIFDPASIPDLKKTLINLRKEAKKNKIGEIYILATSNKIPRMAMRFLNAAFDLPPMHFYHYRNRKKISFIIIIQVYYSIQNYQIKNTKIILFIKAM